MRITIEVCIDSIKALPIAQQGGADRIELCSALAQGGLTPSVGYMQQAKKIASIPVYAMIRPRDGDFIYQADEVEVMLADIHQAKKMGLNGVVFGALTPSGQLDKTVIKACVKEAAGLGVTFHRAIDLCSAPFDALDTLMSFNVERVLTSGQAPSAEAGLDMIKQMIQFCGHNLRIMPGAGINQYNALQISHYTGATELHLSAKKIQTSQALSRDDLVTMGADSRNQDYLTTDIELLRAIRQQC